MPIRAEKWYTRSIFAVADVDVSIGFYCDTLGFTKDWSHAEGGVGLVAQVSRGECEIILAGNLDRKGQGRVFVSLTEVEAQRLRDEITSKGIPHEEIHWGYPSLKLMDPDGNELIFPQELTD